MATLTEVFPCFFLSCKANAKGKTRKDGALPALFLIFVLYVLFCVVLYIVCVYMCTELLPPGGYPIAVNKYIIPYRDVSVHISHCTAVHSHSTYRTAFTQSDFRNSSRRWNVRVYSTVQYSTVYSTVQCTVLYSTVYCNFICK